MLEAIQLGGFFFNHKQTKSTEGTGFPYAMDVKSRSTIWPPRNVEKTHKSLGGCLTRLKSHKYFILYASDVSISEHL